MKLIDRTDYCSGTCIDILKFRKRSLIELCLDRATYKNPSLLVQIGPSDLFYVSVGLVKYIATLTIWGRHYDD